MTIEDFINALESYPATIAAIAAVIAAIGVLGAFIANIQSRWQYKDSIQPQLSMSLLEFDYQLYLQIKNTGGQPAKSIVITVKNIRNNGHQNELLHSAAPNGSWCGDQRQLSAANGTLN